MKIILYILLSLVYITSLAQLPAGKYLKVKDDGTGFELFTLNSVTTTKLSDTATVLRALIDTKQPIGSYLTASSITGKMNYTDTSTMLSAYRTGLNGKQPTGTYSTLAGSEAITNKTISSFNYAADAQASDSYVITLSPAPAAYTTGMVVFFKANTINTGTATINVNGLGAKTINKRVNTVLANGDILALSLCMLIYDGSTFILLNPVVN